MTKRKIRTAAAAILTAAVMLACALSSGCKKAEEDPDSLKVPADTILLAVKKDQTSPEAGKELEKCISEYIEAFRKAEPDIDVSVRYYTELPKDTAGIDCMLLGADDMLLYSASGLTDAGQYLQFAGVSEADIAGGAVRVAKVNDGEPLKMIPFNYDHAVIIADKAAFGVAGVSLPDSNWNLSSFEGISELLTERRDGVPWSGVYMPYYMNSVWQYYCSLLAGSYLVDGYFNFSADNAVGQAIERMYSMYTHNYAYSPKLSTSDRCCAMCFTYACAPGRNNFSFETQKKIDYNPGKRTEELVSEGNLLLLPLPSSDDGKRTGVANTDFIKGFAVPKSSSKQNMAGKFAAFSLTEEGQKILVKHYGGIPANRNMWGNDFWRTGVFSGDNADRALIGVDEGIRDDFTAALKGDNDIYNKNIRMRTVFSAVMVRELGSSKGFDRFIRKLAVFQTDANKVIDGKVSSYSRE
ncbi:MAG: carbohydrate ABC transporter substrate-binding protein [Clostridia bacterium]|nr:carbohydrate ABC transporter substrate-binding protein [Clostridia bacterium]